MTFEEAMRAGDLDAAWRALDALSSGGDDGGLHLPSCYANLASSLDRGRRHDDAIAALERAIELGYRSTPDPRSDIAEFQLRAGRYEAATQIWAKLKAEQPDDVWLYNAAGLTYGEIGMHGLAVSWLGEGLEVAMRADDPEQLIPQLSDCRRADLTALGHGPDELQRRAELFARDWQRRREAAMSRRPRFDRATFDGSALDAEPSPLGGERIAGEDVAVALAWFPAGEYERAISWWPTLAENWAGVAHEDYCRRFDANLKWLRAHGAPVRGVVAIRVASYVAWCGQHGEDPEEARAVYAARQSAEGHMVAWPPERNERCWCGSQRKYKKCCGASSPAPMLPAANERVVASDVLEVDARVRSE